jgi:fructose-bisphosphate aldolase class 1
MNFDFCTISPGWWLAIVIASLLGGATEARAKASIDAAFGAGNKAYAISISYLRPGSEALTATDRANIAEAIMRRIKPKP